MIKEIEGLKKYTNCSMPTNEQERIHKAEVSAYNQAINDMIKVVKKRSIPDVSERTEMRKQAITVFELTKGFTGEPTDRAMKTALEMADYVMRLTNDLD